MIAEDTLLLVQAKLTLLTLMDRATVMFNTGASVSEVVGVTACDLFLEARAVSVQRGHRRSLRPLLQRRTLGQTEENILGGFDRFLAKHLSPKDPVIKLDIVRAFVQDGSCSNTTRRSRRCARPLSLAR